MNAKEAYNKTRETIQKNDTKVLKEIYAEMDKVIAAGGFEMFYKEVVSNSVVQKLKDDGFKIKVVWAEMDDYGNFYPEYMRIAWKGNGGKRKFIDKLKILFGGGKYRCL